MNLPYDYTRCDNAECELARICRRQIDPMFATYQSYDRFPGGQDCHGYIPQDWRAAK